MTVDAKYTFEYIYKLTDPRDDTVRYVGRTVDPEERLLGHLYSPSKNAEKDAWIQELKELGLMPHLIVMETINRRENHYRHVGKRESYWIEFYRTQGEPLFNKTRPLRKYPISYQTP